MIIGMPEFFLGLPPRKKEVRTGFCELDPQGDPDHSRVVNLSECKSCQIRECHMFVTIYDEEGNISGKQFKNHSPEY